MKRFIIYIVSLMFFVPILADDMRMEKGNTFFMEEKYEEAINTYEEILNSGIESADLYYNLGNSYYKTGKLPQCILNYERALLLSPHDKDIRHNLELANTQITDKLKSVDGFFVTEWLMNFKNSTKSDTWALISIASFIIFVFLLGTFFFARTRTVKQFSFFIAIVLFLMSFLSFNFSASQKNRLVNRNTAIIFEPSVTVKSSPSAGGTELFILHEGTKVKIIESLGEWNRIEISDGNEGWIQESTIEII